MKVTIDLDAAEVKALRNGGQVPLSLRDKLGDAVHIRDVGWYLVMTQNADYPRPRWWDGLEWRWAPDRVNGPAIVDVDAMEPERLYAGDER